MSYVILKNSDNKEKIQVSKIFCLGLNYLNHISEMKSERPSEPMIFMKPPSAIIHEGESIILPKISNDVHHEGEIVLLIGQDGKNISIEKAEEYILGIGVGIDVTLRDVQSEAKKKGRPWLVSKGFDTSAPVSDFIPVSEFKDFNDIDITLSVNGQLRQNGNSKDMIFKFAETISYLSEIFTLNKGDLIFTGTPEGVSKINDGDQIEVKLADLATLNIGVKNWSNV